jgi:hypothetical protein
LLQATQAGFGIVSWNASSDNKKIQKIRKKYNPPTLLAVNIGVEAMRLFARLIRGLWGEGKRRLGAFSCYNGGFYGPKTTNSCSET